MSDVPTRRIVVAPEYTMAGAAFFCSMTCVVPPEG